MAASARRALVEQVREVLAPVVGDCGLLLERVEVRGEGARTLVDVVLDLTDADPGTLDLDRIEQASARLSQALDDADVLPASAVLEVSSPGAERELTRPVHFRRALGRTVLVTSVEGTRYRGRLTALDENPGPRSDHDQRAGDRPGRTVGPAIELVPVAPAVKGRRPKELPAVTLALADVRSARVEVDLAGLVDDRDTDDRETDDRDIDDRGTATGLED